jgi:hypothetical protein
VSADSASPAGSGRSPLDKVRALQHTLYRAAKADPGRRFHALMDKVLRRDVLWRAWVAVRTNDGAPGYLEGKPVGDKSVPGKRWPAGGVQVGVPQDPHDMAKAGLLEARSPVVKVRTRRNDVCNRCRAMSRHEP